MTEPARHHTTTDGRRQTRLVIYRGASDVAAKGVMFVVTVVAARWLPRPEFALVALATTLGFADATALVNALPAEALKNILQYHVLAGRVTAANVQSGPATRPTIKAARIGGKDEARQRGLAGQSQRRFGHIQMQADIDSGSVEREQRRGRWPE